jgi:hypothetical protein
MSKWNSENICKFLDIYEDYELLWNTRLEDYMNKSKRESALQRLVSVIAEHNLGHFTCDMLRKRIKSIKTVYRTELMKVVKSQKNGASPEEIYRPKLSWFAKADAFLNDVTSNRKSTCNLVSVFQLKIFHVHIFRTATSSCLCDLLFMKQYTSR